MSRSRPALLALALTVAALSIVGSIVPASALAAPAFHVSPGVHRAAAPPAALAHPASVPSVKPVGPAPAAPSATPAPSVRCPTPSYSPNWNGPDFFRDVQVSFWTPGSPTLTGSNFQVEPCVNALPMYTNGFWLNLSTNVPITEALVTIWGTGWALPGGTPGAISGFDPAVPTTLVMQLIAPTYHSASFYFNDYKYFYPGSSVFFNLTLVSVNATPSIIYSAVPPTSEPEHYANGVVDNATWKFDVQSPWVSNIFENDLSITTTPSVIGAPTFEPNPQQGLQVTIASLNVSGGAAPAIPKAELLATITGGEGGGGSTGGKPFGPDNHTVMSLTSLLGPYPGSNISFNVTVWLPWHGAQIDRLYSRQYTFNWSLNGGWWFPTLGLESNLLYRTSPDLIALGSLAQLPTDTDVNVTIHEPIQNVTISSAEIDFRYTDANGFVTGVLPMTARNANSSFGVLPGLPPGGTVTFRVVAKDIYHNPVSSGNYTYSESGGLANLPTPGYGLFYFEGVDVSTGQLIPRLNFTVQNGSWSETGDATPLGFGAPIPAAGTGYLSVAYGVYTLTVNAFGLTRSATFTVGSVQPPVIVFYLASGEVRQSSGIPVASLTLPAGIGLIAAAVAVFPITNWFKERRAKAEAEQRRITL